MSVEQSQAFMERVRKYIEACGEIPKIWTRKFTSDAFDQFVTEVDEREHIRGVNTTFGSFTGANRQFREEDEHVDVRSPPV